MENQIKKNIVLTGGGTLGSVVPLLAVAEDLKNDFNFVFIGTKDGVEQSFVDEAGMPFLGISSGKFRRYWSWQNLIAPFSLLSGLIQSFIILKKLKPSLVMTAGSYVSVGVVISAWLLRIPVLVHQLDYIPGLANKIMARFAKKITVSFKKSVKDYGEKAVWTGSPVSQKFLKLAQNTASARKFFNLKSDKPVIFVLGGGTGAVGLNRLISDNLYNLCQICQVIHLTGQGKEIKVAGSSAYHQYETLNQAETAQAYAAADLVISRAGMGTLVELAALSKPAIIIPMPDSHQEANAEALAKTDAVIVLKQKKLDSLSLYRYIKQTLADEKRMKQKTENYGQVLRTDANKAIDIIIKELVS
jgi:UDP-N-acetylglucosamine--N-acetylmuramyl-(pentapeptide) pyrophosphoryl-undecaprenol N-acetylglucosamine transferase